MKIIVNNKGKRRVIYTQDMPEDEVAMYIEQLKQSQRTNSMRPY